MKNTTLLYLSILFLSITNAFAQRYTAIKGRVCSADGKPVESVTIGITNTSLGTTTDADGHFQFNKIKSGTYTVKVTAIGLMPEEKLVTVTAGTIAVLNFTLKENANQLNEVAISDTRKRYKVDNPSPGLRLGEPLLQVPQNIQVVTSDQLKDQQVFNMLEGASRNVSGLVLQDHWGNYALIYGRGDRIASFRNGMNIEATWGPLNEDMSFVDRIEFVKGPAGFMLANGNPSGFYNVVTKKPTGLTRQSFDFTTGSFNTYRGTADLDGNITSNGKLQYRLNLMGQMAESFRPCDFTNRFDVAPVLRYKFDDKNTLTAEYTYQFQRMNAFGTAYLFSTKGYKDLPRDFTNAPSNTPAANIYDHSAYLTFEHKFNDKWKVTAQGAYFNYKQIGYSYWISSIKNNGDIDRSLGLWDAVNRNKFGQAFVNGELRTGAVIHRILGGLDIGDKYYIADYNQSGSLDPVTPFNIYHPNNGAVTLPTFDRATPLSERGKNTISTEKYQSVYLQDELGFFNQQLRLTLAGRFTHATTLDPYSGSTNNRQVTPRVGLSYSVDDATSFYGVYDQAFLPQNGNIFGGGKVKPVTGNNLELGIKRDWFGGKWSTSLSVYQILKNNQLVADPDKHGDPSASYMIQLGQTKTSGIEFDARGEIITGLSLMVNYAYTNSEISKDTDPANIGTPVPGFAKHVSNGWLTYRLQHGTLKGVGLSAGYMLQVDRRPWSLSGPADMPNYFRLDGGASYQLKKFSLALNVNNLLDAYLISGGHEDYLNAAGGTVYNWQAEAPRNFRLSLGYRF
ncbi:TonB-dependent receptor [Mucilaginibacter sp. UR6-11]|uniref:TonB-dependent receptor n=1 Tax=Mucilaginibacter sp. UR6-11 TaxID=1435644 RepID=UPI001E2F0738|nr:TonB-dependent receptor [Mucilaginibacter sp. UR6-11]MCC8426557.1 TonB-dependent receptor [Mucilaginibacter sp. UR6-11]